MRESKRPVWGCMSVHVTAHVWRQHFLMTTSNQDLAGGLRSRAHGVTTVPLTEKAAQLCLPARPLPFPQRPSLLPRALQAGCLRPALPSLSPAHEPSLFSGEEETPATRKEPEKRETPPQGPKHVVFIQPGGT